MIFVWRSPPNFGKILNRFEGEGCHAQPVSPTSGEAKKKIAIFGSPNVGKSVLFGRLTGTYVIVSNYTGTTVEVSRAKGLIGKETLPGLRIAMIQKFPSYVFQVGQSQFAIDKELAEGIYVRLEKG